MKTLEVVALVDDVPEKHLRRGQMGTVVELLVSQRQSAPGHGIQKLVNR